MEYPEGVVGIPRWRPFARVIEIRRLLAVHLDVRLHEGICAVSKPRGHVYLYRVPLTGVYLYRVPLTGIKGVVIGTVSPPTTWLHIAELDVGAPEPLGGHVHRHAGIAHPRPLRKSVDGDGNLLNRRTRHGCRRHDTKSDEQRDEKSEDLPSFHVHSHLPSRRAFRQPCFTAGAYSMP